MLDPACILLHGLSFLLKEDSISLSTGYSPFGVPLCCCPLQVQIRLFDRRSPSRTKIRLFDRRSPYRAKIRSLDRRSPCRAKIWSLDRRSHERTYSPWSVLAPILLRLLATRGAVPLFQGTCSLAGQGTCSSQDFWSLVGCNSSFLEVARYPSFCSPFSGSMPFRRTIGPPRL